MKPIEEVLNFIVEIEKLKTVQRKTRPVGLNRYENSAEHSWHVCISALMLKEYSNEPVDIDRVIRMLLIHDLGEIDAGDTIVYSADSKAVKTQEEAGLKRILGFLPEEKYEEYVTLWKEFEAGETPDAVFAKSIDRVPPLLHNIYGDGHSWKDNNISKEKVFSLNSRIAKGSKELWQALESKLANAVKIGLLK